MSEVIGTIKVIDTTKEVGTSGFKKRDLVVTTDEQFPQDILIQFVQDKCEVLDKYSVGQNVTVGVNLRGRMWTNPQGEDVYFNTIQGWRIASNEEAPAPQSNNATTPIAEQEHDDLPF